MTTPEQEVASRVAEAFANNTPLEIRGGGTKRFYGEPPVVESPVESPASDTGGGGEGGGGTETILDMSNLSGIVAYEPSELFVCAKAGTTLAEVESALSEREQALAFEPPRFGALATVGGTVACGLSGPRRPFAGAVRDHILGVAIVDGKGEPLRFGGRVIKNVAGFDVSRLTVGAMGTLGAITEATFRAVPKPECEKTVALQLNASAAIEKTNRMLSAGVPITASAWFGGELRLRFSGAESSAARAAKESGGELLKDDDAMLFWESIREHRHPFFANGEGGVGGSDLWRIACPPLSTVANESETMIEWRGAIRWLRGSREVAEQTARECGGHLTLFRARDESERNRFPKLSPPVAKLHRELKRAFDPGDILNRGRLGAFGG